MINYLSLIGESISLVICIYVSIIVRLRDKNYVGNKLFSMGFAFFAFYSLSMLLYELAINEIVVV
jgi:hypothetical protein